LALNLREAILVYPHYSRALFAFRRYALLHGAPPEFAASAALLDTLPAFPGGPPRAGNFFRAQNEPITASESTPAPQKPPPQATLSAPFSGPIGPLPPPFRPSNSWPASSPAPPPFAGSNGAAHGAGALPGPDGSAFPNVRPRRPAAGRPPPPPWPDKPRTRRSQQIAAIRLIFFNAGM
jgi:hypothetical protein